MVRPVCFNCSKHNELMSLRAEVKRFEDGRKIKNIRDERDKAIRKYSKSENLCRKLAEENEILKDEIPTPIANKVIAGTNIVIAFAFNWFSLYRSSGISAASLAVKYVLKRAKELKLNKSLIS